EVLLYAPASTEANPPQPAMPKTVGKPDSDPASLSAKGAHDSLSAPAAQDAVGGSSDSSAIGQDALPGNDGPGTLSLPDSSGPAGLPDPAAQDPAVPTGRPLE
ncbi:MAG: hypothetical protein AAB242_12810, partial [Nitrospirota bacterium]